LGVRDARVRRIRRLLAQRSARRSEGAFVVEGLNVIEAALEGEADIEALFAAPEAETECPALLDRAARRGIPVHHLAAGVLERVAGTVTPQPVLAVARWQAPALAAVTAAPGAEPKLLVVGLDVRDPGNAGTLIRSTEAAGAHGVIFCRGSVDVTNPKTVRASAGALFHVPVVEGCDPQEVLGVLGDLGLKRIAAVAHDGERPDRVDLNRPVALVFGNEAHGLPAEVLDRVDNQVTIPMPGRSESLNLGMAASILLYEARRQRAPGGAGVSPDMPGGAGVSPDMEVLAP
jgi:RNA methyltransferase, TrmH family